MGIPKTAPADVQMCSGCHYWLDKVGTPDGWCRRYPPIMSGDLVEVRRHDWCGEYKEKEV